MSPLPSDTRSMLQKGNVMSKHYYLSPCLKTKKYKEKKLQRFFLKKHPFSFLDSQKLACTYCVPSLTLSPSRQVSPISLMGKCVANMSGVVVANKSGGTQSMICRQYVITPHKAVLCVTAVTAVYNVQLRPEWVFSLFTKLLSFLTERD